MIAQLCFAISLFFTCPVMASTYKAMNVQYGLTSEEVGDLYLLRDGKRHPLIVLIHGGGWAGGDKSGLNNTFLPVYLNNGFSVFNINYRLATWADPTSQWNIQLQDAQAAVRWVRSMAVLNKPISDGTLFSAYVDPNRIIASGDSAGGHLSLFLGSMEYPQINLTSGQTRTDLYPGVSSKVLAVLDFYGPTDMTQPAMVTLVATVPVLGGKPYAGNETLYQNMSPVFFLTAQSAPTCIIQGMQDKTVPPEQSIELANKLQALGVKFTWIPYNGDHGLPKTIFGTTDTTLVQKAVNCVHNFGIK